MGKALYGLATVLPLAPLSVYAYRFLQEKRSAMPRNYDVFLRFRGPDTRTGFTDFLYNSLVAAGVHVFRDDDALPVGEEIGTEFLRAIRTCRIAIPIISEQYVESTWCLRELTEIVDSCREHGQLIFPVFYKVEVADVRCRRGKFKEALCQHEKQFFSEQVQKWASALQEVASIIGWVSQKIANGHEGELVKLLVAKVSSELKTTWMSRIDRLPMFNKLMRNDHIRSAYCYYWERKRRQSQCQVFLAFRGPDTRYSLAAYLYTSLVAAGIKVFYDDDASMIGKDIARELSDAINHSKISIPILSENCASSSWCLGELALMVECKRTKGQKILPIFYKVKPSHVRDISHRFGEDMLQLQHEKSYHRDILERWERAFREVGSFRGWESEKIANGHEGVLVKRVVEEVSRLLNNPQKHDFPSPSAEYLSHLFPVSQEDFPRRRVI